MENFKKQISEDIDLIKRDYIHFDSKLDKDEYAFNYWILNRLYNMDEEVIISNITDINDKNIDCFVHYEDTKELFIIQNKFYSDDTIVKRNDFSDFLTTPLNVLLNGKYKRSPELQKIFDRAYNDSEYKIWLHFYVTNNYMSEDIYNLLEGFNYNEDKISAYVGVKYYNIDDIERMYFRDRFTKKVSFTATLSTRVSGTSLDVRPEHYGLKWMIPLRYIMVNVAMLYRMYKDALTKNYELFEENVREYLGTRGINNGIIKTLKSPTDRENFFYYNNGITIICEECDTIKGQMQCKSSCDKDTYGFKLKNPQIVNGCQTINSIAEVLSHYNDIQIDKEFERTFVLVKVFVFDDDVKKQKGNLDKNIVKYTNSQNGINDKAFASKNNFFINLQSEFKKRGLLLLVKPSDKNKFSIEYKNTDKFEKLKNRNKEIFDLFDLDNNKLKNLFIPLEKMLKVFLAFNKDGCAAFTKGSSVLKKNSPLYKDFSLNIDDLFTIDNMIRLYFLYNKAENDKKQNDKRFPIPYYLFGFIGQEFKNLSFDDSNNKLNQLFNDKMKLQELYDFYKKIIINYSNDYYTAYNSDYNNMIKSEIDYSIFNRCISSVIDFLPGNVRKFLNK